MAYIAESQQYFRTRPTRNEGFQQALDWLCELRCYLWIAVDWLYKKPPEILEPILQQIDNLRRVSVSIVQHCTKIQAAYQKAFEFCYE